MVHILEFTRGCVCCTELGQKITLNRKVLKIFKSDSYLPKVMESLKRSWKFMEFEELKRVCTLVNFASL